jgi:hypothetical protein
VTWLADTARPRLGGAGQGRGHSPAPGRDVGRTPLRRCFDLTRGDLPAGVYVERILAKLEAITRACAEAGLFKTRGAATATAVQVVGA